VKAFFDTNVLVYAFLDTEKRETAQAALAQGGVISTQVLNEFSNVTFRKHGRGWQEVADAITVIRQHFPDVAPLTADTHARAMGLARNHMLSFYDALIVASAIENDCDRLYSEDLQSGQRFGKLVVVNPFGG
jgi:predicted nucleic acid-binding protein